MAEENRVTEIQNGDFKLNIPEGEKEMLLTVASELLDTIEDTSIKRLYPPAHLNSRKLQKEYKSLTREYLISSRKAAVSDIAVLLNKYTLQENELSSLLMGINTLRVVFASMLEASKISLSKPPSDKENEAVKKTWAVFQTMNHIIENISESIM